MATRRARKSAAWGELALFGLFGVLVLAGLAAGGFYAAGYFDADSEPDREGMLACPALAHPVDAYSAVTRDDLINPQTGKLNVVWLPEKTAERVLRDLAQVIGRVTKKDKIVGMALTENDFFPKGTRPGLAAGIPPGMKAVSIESDRIDGLSLLRMGDRFDLVESLPADAEAVPSTEFAVLLGGVKPPDTRAGQLAKQTGVRTLVRNGQMIALTRGKSRSTEGQQALVVDANRRNREQTTTVATVGVAADEVTPLTEALGLETKIVCVTHSGRGDETSSGRETEVDLSGMTSVVAPFRGLKAFAKIEQHDLVDPVSGRLNEYYFAPGRLDRRWLTSFSQLVGRVPRRDIGPGEPITEDDLLPVGSHAGMTAAAPAGTVIMEVHTDRLSGGGSVSVGDVLSVYRELPPELRPSFPTHEWVTIQGGTISDDDASLRETLRSGMQLVADDVVLLNRQSLGSEDDAKDVFVLAVPTARVVTFSQAIASTDELTVTARTNSNRVLPQSPFDDAVQIPSPLNDQYIPVANVLQNDFADVDDRVAVPVLARDVEPFAALAAEDFVDPVTGRLRLFYFPANQVDENWGLSLPDLLDRVTATGISAGRAVRIDQLLPAGTLPGVAAGVPDGYAAIEVNSFQVSGLAVPNVLDRIDLVAARPMDSFGPELRSEWAALFSGQTFYAPEFSDVFLRTDHRTLSHAAIVLSKETREFEFLDDVTAGTTSSSEGTSDRTTELTDDGSITRGASQSDFNFRETRIVKRDALVCTLAVPEASLPQLLEAMTVQTVRNDDGRDSGENAGDTGGRRNNRGLGAVAGLETLNEVAIHAVTHSSRPHAAAPSTPTIDVIRQWIERWSEQFRRYQAAADRTPIEFVEQIRGTSRTNATFINGVPATEDAARFEQHRSVLHEVLPVRGGGVRGDDFRSPMTTAPTPSVATKP